MSEAFKIVAAIVLICLAPSMSILLFGEIFAPDTKSSITADDGIAGRYHLRGRTTRFFNQG